MALRAGAERVATAHTADDQAETVLLRLLRGSGPDGLAGIPEESDRVVRPLLRVTRAAIEAHARRTGLEWREDASNASPAYARNRVRVRLRELADEFNPRLLRAIADLAEALGQDRKWIEQLVEAEAAMRFESSESGLAIDGRGFEALPEPLARRLARRALRQAGGARDVSRVHLERMLGFLREGRPGTRIELPGGLVLTREGGRFHLRAMVGSGR
jgi:tRNA(Ile)-lysidine synthase